MYMDYRDKYIDDNILLKINTMNTKMFNFGAVSSLSCLVSSTKIIRVKIIISFIES